MQKPQKIALLIVSFLLGVVFAPALGENPTLWLVVPFMLAACYTVVEEI